jgi:hypothetical protein
MKRFRFRLVQIISDQSQDLFCSACLSIIGVWKAILPNGGEMARGREQRGDGGIFLSLPNAALTHHDSKETEGESSLPCLAF